MVGPFKSTTYRRPSQNTSPGFVLGDPLAKDDLQLGHLGLIEQLVKLLK